MDIVLTGGIGRRMVTRKDSARRGVFWNRGELADDVVIVGLQLAEARPALGLGRDALRSSVPIVTRESINPWLGPLKF